MALNTYAPISHCRSRSPLLAVYIYYSIMTMKGISPRYGSLFNIQARSMGQYPDHARAVIDQVAAPGYPARRVVQLNSTSLQREHTASIRR